MARVLYISEGYSTHDRRFLEKLAGSGHRIWFLPCATDRVPLESRPVPPGVERLPALSENGGKRSLWAWLLSWRRLQRVLREIQPDLVHAGPVQSGGFLAALAGASPLLVMSWGSDVLVAADRDAWSRWVTRFTLRRAGMVVADCAAVRERMISLGGLDGGRIVQLPFGVELGRFSAGTDPAEVRRRLGWEGKPLLLSTRSFEPGRGAEVFLSAVEKVLEAHPNVRALMLGDGTLREEVVRSVERRGLSGRIHLAGQVPNDRMAAYFQEADLYVSASESDGTSISLLEAMASGLAVVVPDAYGNREWVTPGTNGWRYPVGDSEALARCIAEALEDGEKRARMGRANRTLVEEQADWDRNFERLLRGYERLLVNHHPGGREGRG